MINPGDTILIEGQKWRVRSATDQRLVLHAVTGDGQRLAAWRQRHGLSVRAAAARLGISAALVSYIEADERSMPDHVRAVIEGEA